METGIPIAARPPPGQSLVFQKVLAPSRAEHGPRRLFYFQLRSSLYKDRFTPPAWGHAWAQWH